MFNKPDALAYVQRITADSKFFRSLVVAFLIIALLMFTRGRIVSGIIFAVLAVLSYYRYAEFRFKATETAYELIVTYFYLKPEEPAAERIRVEGKGSEKCEEPEEAAEKPVRLADLKRAMSPDFIAAHQKTISFLTKGITKPLKLMTFDRAARENRLFISDKNENWFCLQGDGILSCVRGNRAETIFLMPNEIFSVDKETLISFSGGDEPIEILVLEK